MSTIKKWPVSMTNCENVKDISSSLIQTSSNRNHFNQLKMWKPLFRKRFVSQWNFRFSVVQFLFHSTDTAAL